MSKTQTKRPIIKHNIHYTKPGINETRQAFNKRRKNTQPHPAVDAFSIATPPCPCRLIHYTFTSYFLSHALFPLSSAVLPAPCPFPPTPALYILDLPCIFLNQLRLRTKLHRFLMRLWCNLISWLSFEKLDNRRKQSTVGCLIFLHTLFTCLLRSAYDISGACV